MAHSIKHGQAVRLTSEARRVKPITIRKKRSLPPSERTGWGTRKIEGPKAAETSCAGLSRAEGMAIVRVVSDR